jgi:hypothetical protein
MPKETVAEFKDDDRVLAYRMMERANNELDHPKLLKLQE